MPFGKKYRKAVEGLDLSQRFSVEEAVEKSLGASFAKFDETVDVAIGLGVDPKYSDQMVRGAVSLPHGLGKTVHEPDSMNFAPVVRAKRKPKLALPAPTSPVRKSSSRRSRKAGWNSTPPSPLPMSWPSSARSVVCSAPAV